MAAYISRTTGTAFTSNQKFTVSGWIKGSFPPSSGDNHMWAIGSASGSIGSVFLYVQGTGALTAYGYNPNLALATSRLLRDPAAWYHWVLAVDTTQGTPADRNKVYINGVQETAFSMETNYGSSDTLDALASGKIQYIGSNTNGGGPLLGDLSWVQYVDGLQLAPTEFGQFDSTSGIWKIKTDVYGTPGNNGFCLKMEDRANLDLDSSSNAFTFTTSGTLTPTKDTPSNNFCTMNPIVGARSGFTWSNGNNKVVTGTVDNSGATLAFGSGKWYYEILTDTRGNAYPGWQDLTNTEADEDDTYTPPGFLGINPGVTYNAGSGVVFSSFKGLPASDWTDGDYIGLAFDMDNLSAWWSLNGQWYTGDNATPTTLTRAQVSADTNGFDCSTASLFSSASLIAPCMGSSTASTTNSFNFGNGVFASTVLGGTTYNDDAGNGIFKYEPPDGFRAICTKNIKAYG